MKFPVLLCVVAVLAIAAAWFQSPDRRQGVVDGERSAAASSKAPAGTVIFRGGYLLNGLAVASSVQSATVGSSLKTWSLSVLKK